MAKSIERFLTSQNYLKQKRTEPNGFKYREDKCFSLNKIAPVRNIIITMIPTTIIKSKQQVQKEIYNLLCKKEKIIE